MAHINEVRTGFSTDTFNNVEKKMKSDKKLKISQLTAEHCFSIIFDQRIGKGKKIVLALKLPPYELNILAVAFFNTCNINEIIS